MLVRVFWSSTCTAWHHSRRVYAPRQVVSSAVAFFPQSIMALSKVRRILLHFSALKLTFSWSSTSIQTASFRKLAYGISNCSCIGLFKFSLQDKHSAHKHHGTKEIVSDSYGGRYATDPIPKYHLASKVSYGYHLPWNSFWLVVIRVWMVMLPTA
jgi:hypothetical protein